MTREESSEIFIYDVAVIPAFQRRGIGRRLLLDLRERANAIGVPVAFVAADNEDTHAAEYLALEFALGVAFVAADNEDTHALDFYRALGGVSSAVTVFTFADDD